MIEPAVLVLTLLCALLWGCGKSSAPPANPGTSSTPPPASALSITTTSLRTGWAGHAYMATLSATGGTAPLVWKLTGGVLPAGLVLSSSGTISGTPSATARDTPLTFTVTDSDATAQEKSVTLKLSVSPAKITVAVLPARAALTVTQSLTVYATTNDYAGASWSSNPTGGTFSSATSQNGTGVTFTAPATAGVY